MMPKRARRHLEILCPLAAVVFGLGAGCGGDICREAYPKLQGCIRDADCDQAPNALTHLTCELNKANYADLAYDDGLAMCEAAGGDCSCSGSAEATAQAVLRCDLDELTCACP